MAEEKRGSESQEEEERLLHAPVGRYVAVWVALMLLTTATFLLRLAPLGRAHLATALAIAVAKSALVALFFMHLWEQRGANWLVFASAFVFVALLIGLTVADNATRFPLANPPHPGTLALEPPGAEAPRPELKTHQLP